MPHVWDVRATAKYASAGEARDPAGEAPTGSARAGFR